MSFAVLADEHVRRTFVTELRAHGYDVHWSDKGYNSGTTDRAHLEQAVATNRVILSNDTDFARLHKEYDHCGIILYDDQNMPVTAFISGIKRIERFVPESELAGEILWLDDWC